MIRVSLRRNIGKAASGEARRESLRPPIRHAAALLKAGEGSRVSGKGTSFLKIEKNEKKNGENRLTETNAFSII